MKIAFYTLGCKVNQYETEVLREGFKSAGHTLVGLGGEADAVIINSCTVTAESDRKCRQALRRIRRNHPNSVIALTGCMVQAKTQEIKDLAEVDIIVGNTDMNRIIDLTEEFFKKRQKIHSVTPHLKGEAFNTPSISDFEERTRAYMKIEDGCDRFCSYCIIPFARGFVRSKPLEAIKKEAEALAQNGYIEAVLVGINLSSYGKGEGFNLDDAVSKVCSVEGIKRVRLGSIEPDLITDDMLKKLRAEEKFCPQFHLSLQSGCDETLKRMNRHYDTAFYRDLISRIRKIFPDSAITTDIMVGFAGENEEEFQKSLEFVKEIGFAKAHVFSYSRRKGTIAEKMPNQVSNSEKARRSSLMIKTAAESEEAFLKGLEGKTVPVLFETEKDGYFEGYTPNYSRVLVKTEQSLSGKILNVRLIKAFTDHILGEIEQK